MSALQSGAGRVLWRTPSPERLGPPHLPPSRPGKASSSRRLGQEAGRQCPLVPEGLWTRTGCAGLFRRGLQSHSGARAETDTDKGALTPASNQHTGRACNGLFTRKMETWPLDVGDSRVDREGRVTGCVPARGTQQGEQGCCPGCDEGLRRVLNTDLMKSVGFPGETLTTRQASLLMKNSIQISVKITARVGLKWPK